MFGPTHPLQLAFGFIIWSLWFIAIYGGMSVACSLGPPDPGLGAKTWINGVLLLATLAVTALLLLLAMRCWRVPDCGHRRFIARVATCVYFFAALSTLAVGLPSAVLPPCL